MHAYSQNHLDCTLEMRTTSFQSRGKESSQIIPIPTQLNDFRILRPLGQGGSARVFLAETTRNNLPSSRVALKVMVPDNLGTNYSMLRNEAEILRPVSHPNIIKFHSVGQHHGLMYGVLDYVQGWSIKALLKRTHKIPLSACVDIGLQLCSALNYLHHPVDERLSNATVHCDIKPGNILIDRFGRVRLIDFGIACKSGQRETGNTSYGTAAYMAPEQVTKDRIDGRTDLFSLGVMLYEMATGTRLFPGSDIPTLLRERLHATSLPKTGLLHAVLGDSQHHFMRTLQRCIQCDASERIPSSRHLAESLAWVAHRASPGPSCEQWMQTITQAR